MINFYCEYINDYKIDRFVSGYVTPNMDPRDTVILVPSLGKYRDSIYSTIRPFEKYEVAYWFDSGLIFEPDHVRQMNILDISDMKNLLVIDYVKISPFEFHNITTVFENLKITAIGTIPSGYYDVFNYAVIEYHKKVMSIEQIILMMQLSNEIDIEPVLSEVSYFLYYLDRYHIDLNVSLTDVIDNLTGKGDT
jgi:hypothetical protein